MTSPIRTFLVRWTLPALAAVVLSGCALLKAPEAPRDSYELTAPDSVSGLRASTNAQILVKKPNALKSLDSERLVLRSNGSEITYLAGVQWTDTVPNMVQAKLVEAFENTGATGATAKPGDGLVIDYQLISDLRRFEVVTDGAGQAVIELSIKLLSDKSGKVLETQIFTATATLVGREGDDYVRALDAAFDELAVDVIRWVLGRV
ncbi:ABC-type transport auxiliary lipoprotein family protein [Pseudahrensia aquimaris]|uniref:ABC-type transport auxiliary lipoprotein family protein n=1 Tax=Pseudahrensia aquimaris TaxID=744461 RepID=A0ABW3FHL3_9HYPH